MEERLAALLQHEGPYVLFLAQVLGIFGLPIPDEFLMTVTGALVRHGDMNAVAAVTAAIGGSMTGITLSYGVGRTVGAAALRRLHVPDDALARTQAWFDHFGHWVLTFGYFVPGVRHVTAIAAGATPVAFADFARAAYPGAVLWCAVFLGAGYWAADEWAWTARLLTGHVRLGTALLAVLIAAVLLARWLRRNLPDRDQPPPI